jgi:cell division protein ZapA
MAEENEKLHIRLHVYDTELSVNIPRDDEEYYRKSAKLITDIVNSYSSIFKGRKGDKEILYMALIDIALRYEKNEYRNDTAPYSDILSKLTSEIEEALE